MNKYIFLTFEGFTYQPVMDIKDDAAEIENCQVIGFSEGENPNDAFENLLQKYVYLVDTSFDHIYCYKLEDNYRENRADFYLDDYRERIKKTP